ncbi:putative glycoside hydrolase family 15 protein [Actinokineospora sp.]|uniref:putative glycoside hydrolase family 15 protein n=1 Tax=Actinokineospora sp. TaxID=1872133 RepID=UPI003D6BBF7F
MSTQSLNTPRGRLGRALAGVALLSATACVSSSAGEFNVPPPKPRAPCAWWYGIGDSPTAAEIEAAAKRYHVVVLNSWETAAMRKLHELNPKIKVLLYKDLSSTRNYPGTVIGDKDAEQLPTGLGYHKTQREHPEWFAVDTAAKRIEWQGYPRHWQMTTWVQQYQQAWAAAVTTEVTREGWDGVLADNDFNSLSHYSPAVLAGTADAAATDRLLRDGLDAFLSVAGDSLQKAGKLFVPNVSETFLTPGRWTAHSRFAGAMEENFGFRDDNGAGDLLTFQGNEWKELRGQAALGESWLLLVTRARSAREERVGYASAALLAGPYTCWNMATTPDYSKPELSRLHGSGLGEAVEAATRHPNGMWTREFTGGWVAVNPTAATAEVAVPAGLVTVDGAPVTSPLQVTAADGAVLVKPKTNSPTPVP